MILGGAIAKIAAVLVALVLFVVLFGAALYAVDYGVHATVVEKSCPPLGSGTVTVQEQITRARHTQPVGAGECAVIQPGNFVIYNLRSERIRIYTEAGGELIYDSAQFNAR
jgi:hypothetical protein